MSPTPPPPPTPPKHGTLYKTDRQAGRLTDRQTGRGTTDRQRDKETGRGTKRQADAHRVDVDYLTLPLPYLPRQEWILFSNILMCGLLVMIVMVRSFLSFDLSTGPAWAFFYFLFLVLLVRNCFILLVCLYVREGFGDLRPCVAACTR